MGGGSRLGRTRGLGQRRLLGLVAIGALSVSWSLRDSVHATAPIVTISPTGARVQVVSASLSETIDALSRAAGFQVTYEGARPSAMLFNAEIDTPSAAQTLFRLLDGQNLNYGVVFDLSGKNVTSLLILGVARKTGGAAEAAPSAFRPQPFTPPRTPRNDPPLLDDDPEEQALPPEPTAPEPSPSVSPAPPWTLQGPGQGSQAPPLLRPPFAPRPLLTSPFAPRPTPSPSP